ncbi:hypothetical protein [Spartinivicinus poritis]|uniref:Phosphatidylinositol diacylglycerol-lyase n=1 Tax=Spartinivicinus poritis TaxID=2994640 RepID=A0ABT5U6T0_9GAMM|nr:hypothetical protein [Spartinivicinus sp. A2-2]MDE1462017.1 hypothetical protein [Spartinivicinus sp. A2-2]
MLDSSYTQSTSRKPDIGKEHQTPQSLIRTRRSVSEDTTGTTKSLSSLTIQDLLSLQEDQSLTVTVETTQTNRNEKSNTFTRKKRIPQTQNSTLKGDLKAENTSIIAARICGVRAVSGNDIANMEDELVLDIANQIHHDAHKTDATEEQKNDSKKLLYEEAKYWSAAQGVNEQVFISRKEEGIQHYLKLWELALNPPKPLDFRSRDDLAKAEFKKVTGFDYEPAPEIHQSYGIGPAVGVNSRQQQLSKKDLLEGIKGKSLLKQKYYSQFTTYIENNLDKLANAKILDIISQLGVKWTELNKKYKKIFHISGFYRHTGNLVGSLYIFEGENGVWGVIKPRGEIKIFRTRVFPIYTPQGKRVINQIIQFRNPGHIKIKRITTQKLDAILKANTFKHYLETINSWKESNYNESGLITFLKNIIPFYDVIDRKIHDPGYEFKFSDIALDLADLGITLMTIGLGVIGKTGVTAAKLAFKAGSGLSKIARVSKAIKATLKTMKTGQSLKLLGKELVDFVVPVFSAGDIASMAGRGGRSLALKVSKKFKSYDDVAEVATSSVLRRCRRGVGDCISTSSIRTGTVARISNPNKNLPDNTKLSEITMLGSHDAGTYRFGRQRSLAGTPSMGELAPGAYKTQGLNLVKQAKAGSQYFDLRIAKNSAGRWAFFHGPSKTRSNMVLDDVKKLFSYARQDTKNIYFFKFVFKRADEPNEFLKLVAENTNNLIRRNGDKLLGKMTIKETIKNNQNIGILIKGHKSSEFQNCSFDYDSNVYTGWANKTSGTKTANFIKEKFSKIPDSEAGKLNIMQTNIPVKILVPPKAVRTLTYENRDVIAKAIKELDKPGIISADYIDSSMDTLQVIIKDKNQSLLHDSGSVIEPAQVDTIIQSAASSNDLDSSIGTANIGRSDSNISASIIA